MDVQNSYNHWAEQYDTNINKTRDLEAIVLRECVADLPFRSCLEIGCGTGKNTIWLLDKAESITAVDFSDEMLSKAKQKIASDKVSFVKADINQPWLFTDKKYDLITFSLVLEHIEDIDGVFRRASEKIAPGGYLYLGELHPFKQYSGSKARFETQEGEHVVPCFTHHLSEFTNAAKINGLVVSAIKEYFDDNNANIPRLLTIVFQKSRDVVT